MSNKILILVACLILISGCLCCKSPGGGGSTTTLETQPKICYRPYMKTVSGCCLDRNDNNICDNDEETTLLTTQSTTQTTTKPTLQTTRVTAQTTQATSITFSSTQPTFLTTTTTIASGSKAECALRNLVTPATVLYLYTDECCSALTPHVDYVKSKGYRFRYINMDYPSLSDNNLLSCYYSTSVRDVYVPQLICAGSGSNMLITDLNGVRTKINNFAKECGE